MTHHKSNRRNLDGWLVLDKPVGMSSAAAVAQVKRIYRVRKIGHAGTLDPLASGVLPLAFGAATKTVQFMMNAEKEYEFTIRWGTQTTSDDSAGTICHTSTNRPCRADIETALGAFIGQIMQTPPIFSALKIDGQRAYKLARNGKTPQLAPRSVHIHDLRLTNMLDSDHAQFILTCSKGVYVRAIARDLAVSLGTYGHIHALRRTRVGKFSKKTIIGLEKILNLSHYASDLRQLDAHIMPLATVLDDIPALAVGARQAQMLRCGQVLPTDSLADCEKVYAHMQETPIALGRIENGVFHPHRVFFEGAPEIVTKI